MELKNSMRTSQSIHSFNQIYQTEERTSEIEDQLNEIKWEGKNREKNNEMNKASKKYGTMWKDLIYIW